MGQKKRNAGEETQVQSEQTSLILLKRPSIGREEVHNRSLNHDSTMKTRAIHRPKTSSVGIRYPLKIKCRKSSTIQQKVSSVPKIRREDKKSQGLDRAVSDLKAAKLDFHREKKKETNSPLPSIHKWKKESSETELIPLSAKERILAEQIAAAENVMKELHKRNKVLEEVVQGRSSSHEGCVAKHMRLQEEVAHLRCEITALKTREVAPSAFGHRTDEHSAFLRDREADTQQYLNKYRALKKKICEFVAAFPSADGELLLKETEVTETLRQEYTSRLAQVRSKQWSERNEFLLQENHALQQVLENVRHPL